MKTMKMITAVGLIMFGAFLGGYKTLIDGDGIVLFLGAAILGGILGGSLYCLINWFLLRGKIEYGPDPSQWIEMNEMHHGWDNLPVEPVAIKVEDRTLETAVYQRLRGIRWQ